MGRYRISKKCIGSGSFGDVWQGKCEWNQMAIAIKVMKRGSYDPRSFLAEAEIMKDLQHDNIVRFIEAVSQRNKIYIVMELMAKGSLTHFLQTAEGRSLQTKDLIRIAIQIARGMFFMEYNRYVHRDLAARNVLISEENIAKISDFGLTRIKDDGIYYSREGFAFKWTAPEAVMHGRFSSKSDVWSFGILLVELFTSGQIPYLGANNKVVLRRLLEGYRHSRPEMCPDCVYREMLGTWALNPLDRPTFKYLYKRLSIINYLDGYYKKLERYKNMNNREVLDQTAKGFRMPCPPDTPGPIYDIMLKCWNAEPECRPTFDFLHDYLKNIYNFELS